MPDEPPSRPPPHRAEVVRRAEAREALADALRHVLADALSVTALALLTEWNAEGATPEHRALLRRRVAAARRAQVVVARRLHALGRPAALDAWDPSEVPRWMLAGQSRDPVTGVTLLAAGLSEFLASVDAAHEVAREVPDPDAMRVLARLVRRETRALSELQALSVAALERAAKEEPGH